MYYILIAILIAVVIIIIYYFLFPGIFLVNSNMISGYWTDLSGTIHKIIPTGRMTFNINLSYSNGKINGTIFNNGININDRNNVNKYGKYNIKINTIIFNDGEEWYKTIL